MRKLVFLAAAALPLAACATSPYGYGYGNDPYSSAVGVLGGILGAGQTGYGYNNYGYANSGFSQAAVNACANYASRYGRVHRPVLRVALTFRWTSNPRDGEILESGSVVMAKRQQTFKRAARKRKARQHALEASGSLRSAARCRQLRFRGARP